MQSETTERTIITENTVEGWSWHPVWEYDRKEQTNPLTRWNSDIVSFTDEERALSVTATCADLGFFSVHSISCIDWKREKAVTVRSIDRNVQKRMHSLSPAEDSSLTYFNQQMTISLLRRGEKHRVLLTAPDMVLPSGEVGLKADITLYHTHEDKCFCNLLTEKDSKSFTYAAKYTPLKASGILFIEDSITPLSSNSFGTVTWARNRGNFLTGILEVNITSRELAVLISGISDTPNAAYCKGSFVKLGHVSIRENGDKFIIEEDGRKSHVTLTPITRVRMRENLRPVKGEITEIWARASGEMEINGEMIALDQAYSSIRIALPRS